MRLIVLLLAWLLPVAAFAQDAVALAGRGASPQDRTPRRVAIAGYTLALSWAPEYCHRRQGSAECTTPAARGFTLHGLWPDGADPARWPQYCRPTTPLTPVQLRAATDTTPSPRIAQHEWDKHGSCMTADPAAYFGEERRVYRTVRFPDMAGLARRRDLTAGIVSALFAAANPGVMPAMLRLRLNKRGWLEEVWLCLGTDRRPTRCPAGTASPSPSASVRIQASG